MKYLGIDYGSKRIGCAVSNSEGSIAFPRPTISNDAHLFDTLAKLIADEKIQAIVVGDTRTFSGFDNTVTKEAEKFVERMKKDTGLPVEKAWEAGSSIEASRYAPEGTGHEDGAAAAIILQRYLEMH
jgi:putative Holliday junction resolvase